MIGTARPEAIRTNMLQSWVLFKNRISMGALARLVDDAILKILCLCGIVDLLRIEQTCKYLRMLTTNREVWHAVFLRSPREFAPSIIPTQKREEADFRDLALRAMRGYGNWTSEYPKPLWRLSLNIQHSDRMLSDLQFLPGGKFLLYFTDNTLYCFDVKRNIYVLERKNDCLELLQSTYQLQSDGEIVKVSIIGRADIRTAMVVQVEVIEINLGTGQCELISKINMEWSNLSRAAGGEYLMLRVPSLIGKHIMIPYLVGNYADDPSRGAIVVDFVTSSAILLSLQNCGDTSIDYESPVGFSGSHLLYMTGRRSQAPAVHAVPLAQFRGCWRSSEDVTKWIKYDVRPEHDHACQILHLSPLSPPSNFHMSVHPSTWLDLEKVRFTNPAVASLLLVDISFIWVDDSVFPYGTQTCHSSRHFQLQFAEVTATSDEVSAAARSGPFGMFIRSGFPSMSEQNEEPSFRIAWSNMPSRNGRLAACIRTNGPQDKPRSQAVAFRVNAPSIGVLKHLEERVVRHFVLDYYTSIALHSSCLRDPDTLESVPNTAEFVVEGYD